MAGMVQALRSDIDFLFDCAEGYAELLDEQFGSALIQEEIKDLEMKLVEIKDRYQLMQPDKQRCL